MEYTIIIHKAEEGGYWAEAPALEGCYFQGESFEPACRQAGKLIRILKKL